MSQHAPQSRWQKTQAKLKSKASGQRVLTWIDSLSRFWGLRLLPTFKKIVLPGCAGIPLVDILKNFAKRELWQSAKALSYSFLIAIPPLLVFMFSSIAYFPVDGIQDQLLLQLQQIIPAGIFERVADTINDIMGHRHGSLMSIGFITSVILAANGMYGMMMSFNFIDHESVQRPLWVRYAISLVMVMLLYFLIMMMLTLLIGYQLLQKWLVMTNILADSAASLMLFSFGRWIILIFITLLIISLIYYIAPTRKRTIGFFSAGSVLATVLFFAAGWAFQAYLRVFNNYNILYGSIGTLLMVMLWVFAICLVILVGYGINVAVADSRGEEGYTIKITKHKRNGIQHRTPYHRPALRTERDGMRQPYGSPVWFGPAGSVRYTGPRGADGKDRHR